MTKKLTVKQVEEGEVIPAEALKNPKRELFCQLYASDKQFFANGTEAYAEAFNIDTTKPGGYMSAAASASRLLKDAKVLSRINEILDMRGLNDAYVDKQLEFLVTQSADLGTKLQAIKEYNKLKSRIIDRGEVTHKFGELSDDDLDKAIKAREDRILGTS